jgi:hypothetical protein
MGGWLVGRRVIIREVVAAVPPLGRREGEEVVLVLSPPCSLAIPRFPKPVPCVFHYH